MEKINLKDLFFVKSLHDHKIEVEMFKEQFVKNKIVSMLLDRNVCPNTKNLL